MRLHGVVMLTLLPAAAACTPDPTSRDTSSVGATTSALDATAAGFEGVGRLRAGMRTHEALAAIGGAIDTSGGTLPGSRCSYANFSALPPGTAVMLWGDTVVRIDVDSATIRTRWGTGVGSSIREIRERHTAQDVRQELHPYSAPTWHYVVADQPGDTVYRIIFETNPEQRVHSYRVGFRRAVDLIEGCS